MFQSVLRAPQPSQPNDKNFVYQICISGSTDKEPFRTSAIRNAEFTNKNRIEIIRDIAKGFAEPFCSFLSLISSDTEVKQLFLDDFIPRKEIFASNLYTLVGDASHAMTMCKPQRAKSLHTTH